MVFFQVKPSRLEPFVCFENCFLQLALFDNALRLSLFQKLDSKIFNFLSLYRAAIVRNMLPTRGGNNPNTAFSCCALPSWVLKATLCCPQHLRNLQLLWCCACTIDTWSCLTAYCHLHWGRAEESHQFQRLKIMVSVSSTSLSCFHA